MAVMKNNYPVKIFFKLEINEFDFHKSPNDILAYLIKLTSDLAIWP